MPLDTRRVHEGEFPRHHVVAPTPLRAELAVDTKPRIRNARAAANDVAIAAAAVGEILRVGVDRVSLREVAQRAGLTHGATYARYEDVNELLIDLWNSKISTCAVELLELSSRAVEEPNENNIRAFMDRIAQPRPEDVVMVEMLLISRRMPIVYEEMEECVSGHLNLDHGLTGRAAANFLRSRALFGVAMASLFETHYFDGDQSYLGVMEGALGSALKSAPTEVISKEVLDREPLAPEGSDDNLRDRLVHATYAVIAKSGYHGATVSRVARRADCSPGAIYKLYRSKGELVLDALRAIFGSSTTSAARLGSLDAPTLPSDSPREEGHRALFALESTIAGAHHESLRAAVGKFLMDPKRAPLPAGCDDEQTRRQGAMCSLSGSGGPRNPVDIDRDESRGAHFRGVLAVPSRRTREGLGVGR